MINCHTRLTGIHGRETHQTHKRNTPDTQSNVNDHTSAELLAQNIVIEQHKPKDKWEKPAGRLALFMVEVPDAQCPGTGQPEAPRATVQTLSSLIVHNKYIYLEN